MNKYFRILSSLLLVFILLLVNAIPIFAHDNHELKIGDTKIIGEGYSSTFKGWTDDGKQIWEAVVSPNIYSSASDGYFYKSDSSYLIAHDYSGDSYFNNNNSYASIGQRILLGNYLIERAFLFFDTSFLGESTITGGSVKIYGSRDTSDTNFNITVVNGQPTYPHDPLVGSDYYYANYSGSGGTLTTVGYSTSGYNTITLNATGYGWINKSGTTKFGLFSSRDISATAPTGNEYVQFYSSEKGTGYQPYLSVTYTINAPAITTSNASNISSSTARLNSSITTDGGDVGACQVSFGYGTTTQTAANFAAYDTVTAFAGSYSTGSLPYLDVSGLLEATTYYYRVQVKNSASTVTSANEISFTTSTGLHYPTNVQAFPLSDSISLNWTKGAGSNNTYVYQQSTPYPSADPYLVDGTGTATGSPVTLVLGSNTVTVTGAGTFYIVGANGTAVSGAATISGSPVSLTGGNNLIDTGATTGTITINVTSINQNPNLLYNPSFETGDPPTGWVLEGAGASTARSNTQFKIGSYSASLTRVGTDCRIYQDLLLPTNFSSKPINLGAWVWSDTGNTTRLRISDIGDAGFVQYSAYHTGDSTWQYLSVSKFATINVTLIRQSLYVEASNTTSYFDGVVLMQGSAYPATGTLIYSGTGTSYIQTGLTLGTTYYYALVGEGGGLYSDGYSSVAMTTTSSGLTSTGFGTTSNPSDYDITDPNSYTVLSNLEPFYSLTNNFVDSWGMQKADAWAGIIAFIVSLLALLVYVRSRSIQGALIVLLVCLIITYYLGLTSGWWILFSLIGFLGSMALPKREV